MRLIISFAKCVYAPLPYLELWQVVMFLWSTDRVDVSDITSRTAKIPGGEALSWRMCWSRTACDDHMIPSILFRFRQSFQHHCFPGIELGVIVISNSCIAVAKHEHYQKRRQDQHEANFLSPKLSRGWAWKLHHDTNASTGVDLRAKKRSMPLVGSLTDDSRLFFTTKPSACNYGSYSTLSLASVFCRFLCVLEITCTLCYYL